MEIPEQKKELLFYDIRNILIFAVMMIFGYGFWSRTGIDVSPLFVVIIILAGIYPVLKITRWVGAIDFFEKIHDGSIKFWNEDMPLIKEEKITMTIRPWRGGRLKIGKTYLAKLNPKSKKFFAKLFIVDNYRKILKELTPEDINSSGVKNLEIFKNQWVSRFGTWDPEEHVRIVEFKVKEFLE